jgi:hypothetical protein
VVSLFWNWNFGFCLLLGSLPLWGFLRFPEKFCNQRLAFFAFFFRFAGFYFLFVYLFLGLTLFCSLFLGYF